MKRLAVIDGKSVFYRGYYSMPNLSMADGTPTGGVYGFASLALEVIKKLEPDYVAIAWDKPKTNIRRRKELYPEYKAGRKPAPADFYAQIPILHDLLQAFGWPLYECDDYEADDIMGTLALAAEKEAIETCLITSDLDMLQLISPKTHVYVMQKGFTQITQYNPESFKQKYGIDVHQFLDLKSLKGDSSDNIPGVPGVGEKTALQLLQSYKTLDGVYEHIDDIKGAVKTKLENGKDSAYLSKELARIWVDAPVPFDLEAMDVGRLDTGELAALLKKLEFTSLLAKLPTYMRALALPDEPAAHEIELLVEAPWPETFMIDGPVALQVDDMNGELWISTDGKTYHSMKLDAVDPGLWRALEMAELVIAYDVKQTYHQLADHGVTVRFATVFDIRQAAFLLNPLMRDRSLGGLSGELLISPASILGAVYAIYQRQSQALEDNPALRAVAYELDFPLTYMLFRMERKGIKIDVSLLATMSEELGKELALTEQEMYSLVGYTFNIGSPSQLAGALFTKLQLPTTGIKKGKTGYSTDQKTLDKLRGQHPIIELIERSRELAKLKNTYVDTLPKLTDTSGRIHTTFNQDVAATGRLSSADPNLQNIPVRSELGRRIREAFVPEGDRVFVSADYSQFELRLAAVLAGDKQLINDFNGDVDIHTKTASDVYHIPMDQVTKHQRRDAKVINFGVLYGMSPHGLSAATGMNFTEARAFIDHYFELRAPIRTYIDQTLEKARQDGYVETYYGRRRPTPDINSSNFMVREAAKRAAANMPIQGTEADLMKRAMLEIDAKLGDLGDQVLQIHDSILVECPAENAEKVKELLQTTMEAVAPELAIKLKVDVSSGRNWGDV